LHSRWRRSGRPVRAARQRANRQYDGHTLRDVIKGTHKLTGCEIERAYIDQEYRGHDAHNPRRVFISGQRRGIFGAIKRELRRRSAIEPEIGHLKAEGHLGRWLLKGRTGDAVNAVIIPVGYNFRPVLAGVKVLFIGSALIPATVD
jgi:transposase, IS5 family